MLCFAIYSIFSTKSIDIYMYIFKHCMHNIFWCLPYVQALQSLSQYIHIFFLFSNNYSKQTMYVLPLSFSQTNTLYVKAAILQSDLIFFWLRYFLKITYMVIYTIYIHIY